MLVEVCCETLSGVEAAVRGGADRVELCTALDCDGLTPPADLIARARALPVTLHVMIRPQPGAFVCDRATARAMLAAIVLARGQGADGVVLGCLTAEGAVDAPLLAELVDAAAPLPVTFHRAVDLCTDRGAALDALAAAGVARVLTAGANARQASAAGLVRTLALAGGRLGVIAAGGIRAHNVRPLLDRSGVAEVHFSERLVAPGEPDRAARLADAIVAMVDLVRSRPVRLPGGPAAR